jgi:hypothetical protein
MPDTAEHCAWEEDEDGNWATSCGRLMVFEYGPPKEHGYQFCHHCGEPIEFKEYAAPETEDEP